MPSNSIFCPRCDEKIPGTSKFCPKCGVSLEKSASQAEIDATPQSPPPPLKPAQVVSGLRNEKARTAKRSSWPSVIGWLLIVFGLLGGLQNLATNKDTLSTLVTMALLLVVGIGLIRRSGKFVRVGVALILVPVIVYVIVLLTIPATGSYRKHTNEISAIKSINDINQVQQQYKSSFPDKGYAPTLASLGGDPKSGPPTPAAAQMLKSDLAAGAKSGYIFVITDYNKVKINGTERITGYTFTAVPHIVGKTGNRGFCSDESGIIKVDPAGGENCSEPIQ